MILMAVVGTLIAGLVSFIFGVLVLVFPKFLRYTVGIYLIFAGIFLVLTSL